MRRTRKQIVRERGAYHEAGHTKVALYFGFQVVRTTLTEVILRRPRMTKSNVRKYIQVLQAGYISQRQVDKGSYLLAYVRGAVGDDAHIRRLADKYGVSDSEIALLQKQTIRLVRQLWKEIEAFAQELLTLPDDRRTNHGDNGTEPRR